MNLFEKDRAKFAKFVLHDGKTKRIGEIKEIFSSSFCHFTRDSHT